MRRAIFALAAASILAAPVHAQDSEPSETQMRQAVSLWLRDVHSPWDETVALCTGSPLERRGLPPDICSRICAPDSSNCRVPGEVTSFRKGSCRPPLASGQVECSFTAEFRAINPQVRQAGLPDNGLFDRSSGQWRFVRSQPQ